MNNRVPLVKGQGSKVTRGHRNRHGRSATYDFLITFHSNSFALSRTASAVNGDFCQKS